MAVKKQRQSSRSRSKPVKNQKAGLWPWLLLKLRKLLWWAFLIIFVLPVIYLFSLRYIDPPLTPLAIQRVFQGYGYERQWRDLEQIARPLRYAVIAAEDNKFCTHPGFDFKALAQVLRKTLRGERSAGASTISMQTSKNLLLLPQRSFVRKAFEAYYTLWLELLLDKRRILEIYLNIIEFGGGVYGSEAASRHYFGVSASKLNHVQASRLVTVLPSPLTRRPVDSAQARRYERRIQRLGHHLNCAK